MNTHTSTDIYYTHRKGQFKRQNHQNTDTSLILNNPSLCYCVSSRKEQSTGGTETSQAARQERWTLKKKTQTAAVALPKPQHPRPHVSLRRSPPSKKYFLDSRHQEKKEPFFLRHLAATYGTALNRGFMREGPQPTGGG